MAMAPGVALCLETPTEFKSVCVVKTPIAPPKKCYKWQKKRHLLITTAACYKTLAKWYPRQSFYFVVAYLQCPPCHVWYIRRCNAARKTFWNNVGSYEPHKLLRHMYDRNIEKYILDKEFLIY